MSSISKAGIFIDVKQLLDFTYRVTGAFEDTQRNRQLGQQLIQYNLDMISNFTMAFHRRDESISFETEGKVYNINMKGEKRVYVDALEASFDNYQALMEFCFANLNFSLSDRKRGRKNYISAMNSYLGIIKSTSDLRQAVEIMDMITRKNIIKDYCNYKIN